MKLFILFFTLTSVLATPHDEVLSKLKELTSMRETLAASLDGRKEPITEETFKQVCAPVGQALKAWAEGKGFKARQVAARYRNPKNAPDSAEAKALVRFEKDKKLEFVEDGSRLFVPIRVAQSCLHCHGEKDARPEFIKAKYPEDRAFGFKVGDLRGMYAVQTN